MKRRHFLARCFPWILAPCLGSAPLRSATSTRRKPKPRKLINAVTPSPEIEARVEQETMAALEILDNLSPHNLFDNPYLISAVYYRDGFLDDYPDHREDGAPARRIIARITRRLTVEKKNQFVRMLASGYWAQSPDHAPRPFVFPVPGGALSRRRWRLAHRFAIDIFAPEGAPVLSATPGIVVLAESGWNPLDPFSTSSFSGGNTVIVFDPLAGRFYRYSHLQQVDVRPAELTAPGDRLGTVGSTGASAARRGHGNHLHFETNVFDGLKTRPLTAHELRALLIGAARLG